METLFSIARLYHERGSSKETEYFLDQARSLSISIRALGMQARSCIRLGELKALSGKIEDAANILEACPSSVEVGVMLLIS